MFQLIDTLYITEPEVSIWVQDDIIVIQLPDGVKSQIPTERLASIVCFHFPTVNSTALRFFHERKIRVCILRPCGESLVQIGSCLSPINLWTVQQQASQSGIRIDIIRQLLTGRVLNCRNMLHKAIRSRRDEIGTGILSGAAQLQNCCRLLQMAEDLPAMVQILKKADEIYTGSFPDMIVVQKQDFVEENGKSTACNRRFEALRSFLMTQLSYDITVSLESCGLNPSIGFLHQDRIFGDGLVFDLMEELGPYFVDWAVLNLINTRQVGPGDFITEASGHVRITEDARRNIINSWQKRKQELLVHPYLNTKVTLQMVPHIQGVLLTRCLQQEIDGYPPFILE